jgi:hypothetical protein
LLGGSAGGEGGVAQGGLPESQWVRKGSRR